jgi:hypothetical protein
MGEEDGTLKEPPSQDELARRAHELSLKLLAYAIKESDPDTTEPLVALMGLVIAAAQAAAFSRTLPLSLVTQLLIAQYEATVKKRADIARDAQEAASEFELDKWVLKN